MKNMSEPASSIIILAYGDPSLTENCLKSLHHTLEEKKHEILVFDNASGKEQSNRLKEIAKDYDATLIHSETNLGFAGGCNKAAQHASSEVLIFLNNDIIARPGWIVPLLKTLRRSEIGIAGSKLLFPDDSIQHAGIGLGFWGLPAMIGRNYSGDGGSFDQSKNVMAVTGACFAVKSEVFQDLGGFDERFFFSYEDVDFCLRARKEGILTRYCAESELYHFESATSSKSPVHEKRIESEERFKHRWRETIFRSILPVFRELEDNGVNRVAIYGAGRAGLNLLMLLNELTDIEVLGFVQTEADESIQTISGLPTVGIENIPWHIDTLLGASIFLEEMKEQAVNNGHGDKFYARILENVDPDNLADSA